MAINTHFENLEIAKKDSINLMSIMDIDFINMSKEAFLGEYLYPTVKNRQKCFIVTANPEIVMKTRENTKYKSIVQSADYVLPDGAGVVMASKYMKQPIEERIAGFDLMQDLLAFANQEGLSCFFLGGKEDVNEKAVHKIKKRYPNLKIAGSHHGYFAMEDELVVKMVKDSKPDMVFVALGAPRQEEWIVQYKDEFSKGLFMGVGGSFDVIAGEVKRAPDKWIKLNLEWLYRLLKQPFRWKRILKAVGFMFLVLINGRKK